MIQIPLETVHITKCRSRDFSIINSDEHLPVMFIKSLYSAQYTVVYSHANAEDISQLHVLLVHFHVIEGISYVLCLIRYTVTL